MAAAREDRRGGTHRKSAALSACPQRIEKGREPLRPLPALMTIDDILAVLGCGRRWWERQRAAGLAPTPDFMVGNRPRWRAATISRYLAGDGAKRGR